MDSKAQFGSNVRRIRRDRGFSQEELADRARLHRTYVGGVERGERNISLENILVLAEALNSNIADLFLGVNPTRPTHSGNDAQHNEAKPRTASRRGSK